MPLNYVEMGQIAAIFAAVLALWSLIVYLEVKRWLPKKERELLSKGEIWMGGAIGRFMQNLSEQAAGEEGSPSSSGGALNLGGFKIDAGTIKMGLELIKTLKEMGILGGGGGGGTANPFLK